MRTTIGEISRRRKLLEPLSVAYRHFVVNQSEDPCDVVVDIGHGIVFGGETLKAAHECWLEYGEIEEEMKKNKRMPMIMQQKNVQQSANVLLRQRYAAQKVHPQTLAKHRSANTKD